MREDWTTLLTEEERKVLARAYTALERSVAQANPWYRRSPARAKAIVSAYRSLAASRALVVEIQGATQPLLRWALNAEVAVAIDRKLCSVCGTEGGSHSEDCELRPLLKALAFKEADMLKRLEAK